MFSEFEFENVSAVSISNFSLKRFGGRLLMGTKKELTLGDILADKRPLLNVIREDDGQRILVHPALVEFVSADRVKIMVGRGGFGRVVPEDPTAN